MNLTELFPTHIDDETSLEFAEVEYNRKYIHVESGDLFEKDCSGQWYVQAGDGLSERGPFSSFEHACDCMCHVYEG